MRYLDQTKYNATIIDKGMLKYEKIIESPAGIVMLGLSKTRQLVHASIKVKGNKRRYITVKIHPNNFVFFRCFSIWLSEYIGYRSFVIVKFTEHIIVI